MEAVSVMLNIHPQNTRYLYDAFGSPITEGSCVMDCDRQVGYVRLDLGPHVTGPDSAAWDGWFNVTVTRSGDPLRGKVMNGELVQIVRGGASDL
jgi:hypothetical protein